MQQLEATVCGVAAEEQPGTQGVGLAAWESPSVIAVAVGGIDGPPQRGDPGQQIRPAATVSPAGIVISGNDVRLSNEPVASGQRRACPQIVQSGRGAVVQDVKGQRAGADGLDLHAFGLIREIVGELIRRGERVVLLDDGDAGRRRELLFLRVQQSCRPVFECLQEGGREG